VQRTARTLAAAPERVDPERPLTEMGLDSLLAVELQAGLRADLAVQVEMIQLLDGITLRRLAGTILEQLATDGHPAAAVTGAAR
jgi:aryl carrier-like protein